MLDEQSPPRRADARRNREAILEAAIGCFRRRPDASIGEIAEAAGLGRVTLYAHFSSRAALVEEAFRHVLAQGDEVLKPLDLSGDPARAVAALVSASWRLVDDARAVLAVAQNELGTVRIRELHGRPAARAEALIARGQAEGAFRDDLATSWLVATMHHVMHGAADEIAAGRLDPDRAADHITKTVLAAFGAPPRSG